MNPKPDHYFSDESLVAGLKVQDTEVIRYLYDHIGKSVIKMVISSGGGMEDARDIFQEGILAAYLNIHSGKYELSGQTKFSTYLMQICKYKWYDHQKSAYVRLNSGELPDLSSTDGASLMPENEDRIKILMGCFRRLGDRCQRILHLFYWEKRALEEIGKEMNMETGSVKNQKYRCMKKLRAIAKGKK